MALPIGVKPRGSVFHIQIKVPADLRTFWPTPFFIRKSLETEDRAEATAKGHRHWADATEAFAKARTRLNPAKITSITPALREAIAQTVYAIEAAADMAERTDKTRVTRMTQGVRVGYVEEDDLNPDGFAARAIEQLYGQDVIAAPVSRLAPLPLAVLTARNALNTRRAEIVAGAVSSGDLLAVLPIAEAAAKALGLSIDWESDDGAETLQAVLQAYACARGAAVQRDMGAVIATPEIPQVPVDLMAPVVVTPKPKEAPLKLRDVVPHWLAAKARKANAQIKTDRALTLFEASGQNFPLTSLTRVHGAALRAYLVHPDRTFKGKTALNNWSAIQALMNVAEDVGLIPRNAWRGMTLEVTGSEKRTKHTREELKQLFNTPLFFERGYPFLNNVSPDDAYWCMLLGLWTGARVGEIAQLEMADVLVQNGLDVLSIHGRAGTIKTEQSERIIPVPPDLIRLGFLEWVAARRDGGAVKLFQTLHRVGAVTPAEIMSEWNREYRRAVGAASGPLNGFHRFRHTVRSALAALHIGKETADALTGHGVTGSSGTVDYTHIDAEDIYKALERLKFPLDLPRIYQTPYEAPSAT